MSKILLLVSLLAAPAALCAQTATDHFHRGAQYYVFGDKTNAVMEVVTGLQKFPDDAPLQSLAEILRKQEQQQQQSQQNQEQQKKESDKQEQQQQAKQDQKEQQSQEKKDQQKQNQEKSKATTGEEQDKPDQQNEPSQSVPAHAMTPEEARQLLDAQKGDEQVLQFRPQGEPQRRDKKLKDW